MPGLTPQVGRLVDGPRNAEVTGEVVLILDASGDTSGCLPITSPVAGKIAFSAYLFECAPDTVLDNATAAGAIGVIMMINFFGFPAFDIFLGTPATLPGVVLGFDDGNALLAALPSTATISIATTVEHDGDFDNAIVAHEWGHYLHHRLAVCGGTGQCTAMSEGWGDFNALMMMLRPTDNRDGTFGAGLYALTAGGLELFGDVDPGYFGIRRYPYSIDRSKNGLSFRHIADAAVLPATPTNPGPSFNFNSEPHNAGEVWAAMLWDVYNVLVDERGAVEAHRRMTDYIVAGLLLHPAEATFTEARDAMLAATGALDTDDMLLMAAAFAGRGAGTCAVGPPNTSFDFLGIVESGTVAARLATSSATLVDDGASCDHDGYLDPGESGTLTITIANHGVVAAESIAIRPTTTTPGVTLGNAVKLDSLAPLSQVKIAIPVKLAANAPVNTNLDIAITIDGDAGCNTSRLAVEFHERMGVDEALAVATTDGFETRSLAPAWTRTGALADQFWTRTAGAGANHLLFGADAPFRTDTQVVSPVLQVSPTAPLVVNLSHAFELEAESPTGAFFDGGVIEVSSDGGATWRDVTQLGVDPGYSGIINPADGGHPLRNRPAFSGVSPAFPALQPLPFNFGTQFAGQAIQLRFRLASDPCCTDSSPAPGWLIDNVSVTGIVNKPFSGFVPEPTRCTAPTVEVRGGDEPAAGVLEIRQMPFHSLRDIPATEPD